MYCVLQKSVFIHVCIQFLISSCTNQLSLKGKGTQKCQWILSNSFWKTAHFDANCMKMGFFFFFKILRFYVFKMAANGGLHFETNIKNENY